MAQKRYEAQCDENGAITTIVDPDTGKPISASSLAIKVRSEGTGLFPALDRDGDSAGAQQLLATFAAAPAVRSEGTGLFPELDRALRSRD